ncbi:hypothetical protein [Collimonas silvisoli]|uniref:hypothetical protein n=1 Tax=Collimonas silvisoli TaxID=2825884 RepID=UPI001B8D9CDB|nr:hypothetical protein [Collimonas silvisoli]
MVIRDGIVAGSMNPLIDPEHAATALWAMMNGLLSLSWSTDKLDIKEKDFDKLLETALMIIGNGLKNPLPQHIPKLTSPMPTYRKVKL